MTSYVKTKDGNSYYSEKPKQMDKVFSAHPTENQPLTHVSQQMINDTVDIFPTKL